MGSPRNSEKLELRLNQKAFQQQNSVCDADRSPFDKTPKSAFNERNFFNREKMLQNSMRADSLSEKNDFRCQKSQAEFEQEITYYQEELDTIGEQLIMERRKVASFEDKVMRFSKKNNDLKVENFVLKNEFNQTMEHFKILSDNFSETENIGKSFQVDEKGKTVTMSYKKEEFAKEFKQFIRFIQEKLTQHCEKPISKVSRKADYNENEQPYDGNPSFFSSHKVRGEKLKSRVKEMTKSQFLSPSESPMRSSRKLEKKDSKDK